MAMRLGVGSISAKLPLCQCVSSTMQMRFILTATGAKSGKPRTVALLGIPHPDGVAVVAANYGDAKHPAWYHKLKANPAATVVKCQWVSAT